MAGFDRVILRERLLNDGFKRALADENRLIAPPSMIEYLRTLPLTVDEATALCELMGWVFDGE